MFDYTDQFIFIRFHSEAKGLYVCWLPGNQCMSISDFSMSINFFLNEVTVTQPTKVLINATDYNFPILPEETTQLLRYALSGSQLKHCGLIKSNHLYGQIVIDILLKRLATSQIKLILFDKRVEGLRWFLSK